VLLLTIVAGLCLPPSLIDITGKKFLQLENPKVTFRSSCDMQYLHGSSISQTAQRSAWFADDAKGVLANAFFLGCNCSWEHISLIPTTGYPHHAWKQGFQNV